MDLLRDGRNLQADQFWVTAGLCARREIQSANDVSRMMASHYSSFLPFYIIFPLLGIAHPRTPVLFSQVSIRVYGTLLVYGFCFVCACFEGACGGIYLRVPIEKNIATPCIKKELLMSRYKINKRVIGMIRVVAARLHWHFSRKERGKDFRKLKRA